MSRVINPCNCGYQGELAGMNHQGVYFSLSCPECNREAKAFTMDGLIEAWNKPAPTEQQLVECDRCPTSGGCVNICMRADQQQERDQ